MATVYTGYRPILQGRNSNNWIGPKGRVGVYSNYSLRDTGNEIFTGFPDHEHVLGTYKHARLLEYLTAGGQHVAPMKDPGSGARLSYHRYHPYENKAAGNNKVFTAGYGHQDRVTSYSAYTNYIFDGLDSANVMYAPGHARRFNKSYGGAFDPHANKGVMPQAMATLVDNPLPTDPFNHSYGKNQMKVWRGVPSGRAL